MLNKGKIILKEEEASMFIEAAIVMSIYFFFLFVLFLMIVLRFFQLDVFNAELNLNKELSLAMAVYNSYNEQTLYYYNNDNNPKDKLVAADFGKILNVNGQTEANNFISELISCLIKGYAINKISEDLLSSRFNYWFSQMRESEDFEQRLSNKKYFIEAGNVDGIYYKRFFADYNMGWANYNLHLELPIFSWQGDIVLKERKDDKNDKASLNEEDNFWSWHNFKRGAYLREQTGSNLPYSYPVISNFQNGEALMIKSIDLTSPYYADKYNLDQSICAYIYRLDSFQGSDKAWGKGSIMINKDMITKKKLILYIPENSPAEVRHNLDIIILNEKPTHNFEIEIREKEVSKRYIS